MDRYFSPMCVQKIIFRIIKKREQEQKKQKKRKKKERKEIRKWKNRHTSYDIIEFLERKIYIEDGAGLHDRDTKSFRDFTYVLIIRYVETWKVSTI